MVQNDPRTYNGASRSPQRNGQSARKGSGHAGGAPRADSAQRQQRQPVQQQRRRQTTARQNPARQYQRDAYASGGARSSSSRSSARPTRPQAMRNPSARRAPSTMQRSSRKRRLFPLKRIIIALVAIVAIVVVVAVAKPFGAGDTGETSRASNTAMTTGATSTAALPTPIMAESSGIELHSAVAMKDLTEILIHNASYAYADEITTQLTEATNTQVIANHGTGRKASEQPTGDKWMTGEFIRCYRSGNAGPTMSAIDCGGSAGSTVYAPVSGKVVLVKKYQLYEEFEDVQVHIQPEGRSDLDVVLIHLTDVTIQAGDTVEAGVTPLAKIRDVYQYIGESMQLKQYTATGDNGNHTHIQVNNANDPEYHGLDDLKPATSTSAGSSVVADSVSS
jgi:biotin carboxyl carrier protein